MKRCSYREHQVVYDSVTCSLALFWVLRQLGLEFAYAVPAIRNYSNRFKVPDTTDPNG